MPLLTHKDLQDILRDYPHALSICLAVRVGSQVYGNAQEGSDTDFVVITSNQLKNDLLFGKDYNVTLFSREKFTESLKHHSIFAFEILHTPAPHRLYDAGLNIPHKLDTKSLEESAITKSNADWNKGLKLIPYETTKAQKKLWHSVRILMFACQLKENGEIYDFEAGNDLFEEIITDPSEAPTHYELWLGPIREGLCEVLKN